MSRSAARVGIAAAAEGGVQPQAAADVVVGPRGGATVAVACHHAEHARLAAAADVQIGVSANGLWVGHDAPRAEEGGRAVPIRAKGVSPGVPIRVLGQLVGILGHETLRCAFRIEVDPGTLVEGSGAPGLQEDAINMLQPMKGDVLGIVFCMIGKSGVHHLVRVMGFTVGPPCGGVAEVVLGELHNQDPGVLTHMPHHHLSALLAIFGRQLLQGVEAALEEHLALGGDLHEGAPI
mmetsp:Transcript_98432/g.234346  ORF Transcript_98432/g.234346 Transcript_98432/m.234346 type:complete len:235 (+) Transcript_98432:851-1555(+)